MGRSAASSHPSPSSCMHTSCDSGRPAGAAVWRPALTDVALFSVFALHHSLFARTPFKAGSAVSRRLSSNDRCTLGRQRDVRWCAGGGCRSLARSIGSTALGDGWLGASRGHPSGVSGVAGARRARSRRGAPVLMLRADHVPLMTSGVFAIVRHPLYLGWTLLVFGAADMTATRAVFAIVSTGYCAGDSVGGTCVGPNVWRRIRGLPPNDAMEDVAGHVLTENEGNRDAISGPRSRAAAGIIEPAPGSRPRASPTTPPSLARLPTSRS